MVVDQVAVGRPPIEQSAKTVRKHIIFAIGSDMFVENAVQLN